MALPIAIAGPNQSYAYSTLPKTIQLAGDATPESYPITAWHWEMLDVPDDPLDEIKNSGDFTAGIATIQNPTFIASKQGGYTLQLKVDNVEGCSVPEADKGGGQTGIFISSEKLGIIHIGKKLYDYDDILNETLTTLENGIINKTLDSGYDGGGSGTGRTVTADGGAVQVNADGNAALKLTSSNGLGSDNALNEVTNAQTADNEPAQKIVHSFKEYGGSAVQIVGENDGDGTPNGKIARGLDIEVVKKLPLTEYWWSVSNSAIMWKKIGTGAWNSISHGLTVQKFWDIKGISFEKVWACGENAGAPKLYYTTGSDIWQEDTDFATAFSFGGSARLVLPISETEIYVVIRRSGSNVIDIVKGDGVGGWTTLDTGVVLGSQFGDPKQIAKLNNQIAVAGELGIRYSVNNGVDWTTDTTLGGSYTGGIYADVNGNRFIAAYTPSGVSGEIRFYHKATLNSPPTGGWTQFASYSSTSPWTYYANPLWIDSNGKIFCGLTDNAAGHGFLYDIDTGTPAFASLTGNTATGIHGVSSDSIRVGSSAGIEKWNGSTVTLESGGLSGTQFYGIVTGSGTAKFRTLKLGFSGQDIDNEAIAIEVVGGATHAMKASSGSITMIKQEDPPEETNYASLFPKEIDGRAEWCAQDDDGNVTQIIDEGDVNVTKIKEAGGQKLGFGDVADTQFLKRNGSDIVGVDDVAGSDVTAIHDDTAGEINAIDSKPTPVAADVLVLEDSDAAYAKKKMTLADIPAKDGADSTAIHDNVNGEINAIDSKPTPVAADVLVLEDSDAAYAKKKMTLADIPAKDGADSTAIHDDTSGEINAITKKDNPVNADIIVIEDSDAGYGKKKAEIGDLPFGGGVPTTRVLTAGVGLSGGGDLSADRTFDMTDMGANTVKCNPTASSGSPDDLVMGASTMLARLASGNIKAATTTEINTLLNTVTIAGIQTITGAKKFGSLLNQVQVIVQAAPTQTAKVFQFQDENANVGLGMASTRSKTEWECISLPTITGTAQAGDTNTITLAAGSSAQDNFYVTYFIEITAGTGSGQTKQVSSYDGSTKVATVNSDWSTTPDNTSQYEMSLVRNLQFRFRDNGASGEGELRIVNDGGGKIMSIGQVSGFFVGAGILSNITGNVRVAGSGKTLGFYGSAGGTKPSITGSRGGNAALADLLTELAALGLIFDNST